MPYTVVDSGETELAIEIKKLLASEVEVGILSDAPHTGGEAGESLLDIAQANEFGVGVPERSFLRGWVDERGAEVEKAGGKLVSKMVNSSEPSAQRTLDQLGLWSVGQIQKRIAERIPPPNSPYTIRKKGSDVPLIDTGQLRSSIVHKVVRK